MDNEKRNSILNNIGKDISRLFPDWYGSVRFNIKDGKVININIEESIKCQKEKQ